MLLLAGFRVHNLHACFWTTYISIGIVLETGNTDTIDLKRINVVEEWFSSFGPECRSTSPTFGRCKHCAFHPADVRIRRGI